MSKIQTCLMQQVARSNHLKDLKIEEEELDEIFNDFDPIEAPPGEYKIQPDKPGERLENIIATQTLH